MIKLLIKHFKTLEKEYFRLEVTSFALLFNIFNVYFHSLQNIIEQPLIELGFKEWLGFENEKGSQTQGEGAS